MSSNIKTENAGTKKGKKILTKKEPNVIEKESKIVNDKVSSSDYASEVENTKVAPEPNAVANESSSPDDESEVKKEPEPEPETEPIVVQEPVKKGKGRKVHKDKATQYDDGYTKTEDGVDYIVKNKKWVIVKPVSEKKTVGKRAPTLYSTFLSKTMKEVRLKNPGLPNTEYMKMAVTIWKGLSVEEKDALKVPSA